MTRFVAPTTADIIAGVSVALVVIPQALAYADLAGVPPRHGLFAAALPSVLAAPFTSSKYLQTGPVALTALLSVGALQGLAEPFSAEYIGLAGLLAVLVGLTRAVLGLIRLGGVAYLLSDPVLMGFTTAAASLIIASQTPKVLGVVPGGNSVLGNGVLGNALEAIIDPSSWRWSSVAFAIGTAAIVVGGRRIHALFPGILFAVLGGLAISHLTGYAGAVVGSLPGGFLTVNLDLPWASASGLIPAAVLIGLIGFAEPASIARHYAALERTRWDANREMFGQGIANLVSGIAGGFPIGGSFSRTSINHASGAKSAWAGAFTGIAVIAAIPLSPALARLPTAILGALIITGVFKLVDFAGLAKLVRVSPAQAVVGIGTFASTIVLAPRVERGVVVGIALALGAHLYRELTVTVTHKIQDSRLIIRPQGVLWFAAVPRIEQAMQDLLAEHTDIRSVIIDLGAVGRLDYSGAATLERVLAELRSAGVEVDVRNVPPGAARAANIHIG